MRRLTILLAALGALLLVPAAQALAAHGHAIIEIEGTGKGQLVPGAFLPGNPPVNCSYASPGPATGTCEPELSAEFGVEGILVKEIPAAGSEFAGWSFEGGDGGNGLCTATEKECGRYWFGEPGKDIHIAAYFNVALPMLPLTIEKTGSGSGSVQCADVTGLEGKHGTLEACAAKYPEGHEIEIETFPSSGSEVNGWTGCDNVVNTGHTCMVTMTSPGRTVSVDFIHTKPTGPTNLRTLTITKNANGPGGTGSVSSKPKGIKCGATCSSAIARMYKSTPVELSAKPATGSAFVKWENAKEGGSCDGSTNAVCVVPMAEDESLEAVFSGASKTITPTEALTVSKGESTGKGTVKGPGLGCEAECSSTVVLIQGPITEPKAKPGKIVVLKQAPAFGSKFSGWSGCESEPEGNCQVAMETAKEVTAEYEALPGKVLTVNKEYAKGNGSVSSKPKGIACGTTCTQSVAQMPEGAAVELVAKPSTGTFVKWEGGDCNGSTSTTCVVTMNTDETTKAVFSDPGKAIPSAQTLTLNKAGSGLGTVKASGIKCEVLCSSQSALYQGPITEPKAKPGKIVILKATSAPGSKAVEWTGCDSNPSPSECAVEMDEAHAVTATFEELE